MRIFFIALAVLTLTKTSWALDFQIVGPCTPTPLFKQSIKKTTADNIGDLTVEVFERFKIPYKGTPAGINQIYDTPVGLDAMEVISDTEMMAYGWCYEIDGVVSEKFANEVMLDDRIKSIRWFYGYAHLKDNVWIAQCLKSYERRSPQLCSR